MNVKRMGLWFVGGLAAGVLCGLILGFIPYILLFLPCLTLMVAIRFRERNFSQTLFKSINLYLGVIFAWVVVYAFLIVTGDFEDNFLLGNVIGMGLLGIALWLAGLKFHWAEMVGMILWALLLGWTFREILSVPSHFVFVVNLMVFFGLWQGGFMAGFSIIYSRNE